MKRTTIRGQSTVTINGQTFSGQNSVIVVNGNRVMVNGTNVAVPESLEDVAIVITGNPESVRSEQSITVNGSVGGNVDAGGSVQCDNVRGDVRSNGSVNCDEVGGSVQAGGSVNCDDVGGSVRAGGSINRS